MVLSLCILEQRGCWLPSQNAGVWSSAVNCRFWTEGNQSSTSSAYHGSLETTFLSKLSCKVSTLQYCLSNWVLPTTQSLAFSFLPMIATYCWGNQFAGPKHVGGHERDCRFNKHFSCYSLRSAKTIVIPAKTCSLINLFLSVVCNCISKAGVQCYSKCFAENNRTLKRCNASTRRRNTYNTPTDFIQLVHYH